MIIILTLLVTAVSCAAPTCEESTVDYRAAVDSINEEWDDAIAIANSTARMSLAGPLGELQSIAREARQIEPPECAQDAHVAWVSYQEFTIGAFLAFMGQEDDAVVSAAFADAEEQQEKWVSEYLIINGVQIPEE
ncbi:MAG: hypothetical protein IPM52_14520 [Bacteroidetes bacterium]|nr:hypothetical protein [Bacteroidota bacterium]